MLIDPPIDKLLDKVDCNYELVCAVAKRTRELLIHDSELLHNTKDKPITVASKEIYEGKVLVTKE